MFYLPLARPTVTIPNGCKIWKQQWVAWEIDSNTLFIVPALDAANSWSERCHSADSFEDIRETKKDSSILLRC